MAYDPKNDLPPPGSFKRSDGLLPESEFRPSGSADRFGNGLSREAENAFKNPARLAGRVGPGWRK
jgi:hypothetical protein